MASSNKATLARKDGKTEESVTFHRQEVDTPVLPVDQLEQLHRFRPDVVDWILRQTEEEAVTRRKRLARIDFYIWCEKFIGQILGAIIGLSGVVGGAYVAKVGHPGAGATIATVAIGTLAVAFIGKLRQ